MADPGSPQPSGWTETATGGTANAAVTVSHAAESNKSHYVTAVLASFDAAGKGKLELRDGTTVVAEREVYDAATITFSSPIKVSENTKAEANLAAAGTGITGRLSLIGYTAHP